MNTEKKLTLTDGIEIKLTLNYGKLYKLQSNSPDLVNEYFQIQAKSEPLNEFEMLKVIYIAYLCAENNDSKDMTYEEFLNKVPENRVEILKLYNELLFPKN